MHCFETLEVRQCDRSQVIEEKFEDILGSENAFEKLGRDSEEEAWVLSCLAMVEVASLGLESSKRCREG